MITTVPVAMFQNAGPKSLAAEIGCAGIGPGARRWALSPPMGPMGLSPPIGPTGRLSSDFIWSDNLGDTVRGEAAGGGGPMGPGELPSVKISFLKTVIYRQNDTFSKSSEVILTHHPA